MSSMPLFISDRERRLWFLTLAVVAAIFSTLGLATRLAGALRERGAGLGKTAGSERAVNGEQ